MANKTAELRRMTEGEIAQAIHDTKQELFNLRFQWTSGQLEDYTRVRQLKKQVARLLTIQHERHLAVELLREDTNE